MQHNTCLICTHKNLLACNKCKCHYCMQYVCNARHLSQCSYAAPRTSIDIKKLDLSAKKEPIDCDMCLDLTNVFIPYDNDVVEGPNMYGGINNSFEEGITSNPQIVYTNLKCSHDDD